VTTAVAAAGYRSDLEALRRLRRAHEASADPRSPAATSEGLTLRHREVVLSGGRPDELLTLGAALDRAVERFPAWPDLALLRAGVALAVHRPDLARTALDAVPGLAQQPAGRVLTADLAAFAGDYGTAREEYLRAAGEDPAWDTTARLAALAVATGRLEEADARYADAEDEITAKQMRAFAWVRVQRADLARELGDLDHADAWLADADRAYPGWWYVTAHRAALDLAGGRAANAVEGYRRVLAEVDRPEFREALGTALARTGDDAAAARCHAAAKEAYLRSVLRGEVHYLHHLAAHYADVARDPEAAVVWAQRDACIRRSGPSLSLLGWCLFRAGRVDEARAALAEALSLGAGDPRLHQRVRAVGAGNARAEQAAPDVLPGRKGGPR
jgi:tetratricopeptide (TPR) repeat protein